MAKMIGYIVAGATLVVGGGVGIGVYFGTKNNNQDSVSNIRNYDFEINDESSCTETQCGVGGYSIKQLQYQGKYFLTKTELSQLYTWWIKNIVHGPEIAFFNGITIKHDSESTGSGVTFGDYSWYLKSIRLYTNGYKNNSDSKIKFFQYTIAHEYGHHLTQWYFKNGLNSNNVNSNYRTTGGNPIDFNKKVIERYIKLRGLDQQKQFTDCNPPNTDCGIIEQQDAKYYINILEWLTRDETYLTQTYLNDYSIGGSRNAMVVDDIIRESWGDHGGNTNLASSLSQLNDFFKEIIGLNSNLTNGWAISSISQRLTNGVRYSSFLGFTHEKYKCILETSGNNIVTALPIKYDDSLFNYQFRHELHTSSADKGPQKEIFSTSAPLHVYYTHEFTPNKFSNNAELKFSNSCSDINQIKKIPSVFPGISEKFLAGQGDEAIEPTGGFYANVVKSKGSVLATNKDNNQIFIYNSEINNV